ncbi:Golgi apparatus membrane protein tvp23 [Ascosphaera acerosa]|nr:Golgi apparatus membrane protein tvp23 [Ascosphaera acerosa]
MSLLMYLFGVLFIRNFILVFIITLLLLSADFYYLKNIAGRRLVGLRWWNEVVPSTTTTSSNGGYESHWVFESSEPGSRVINGTDKRFFWLALYATPALWIALAILAVLRLQSIIWLSLVGIALVLTITNTVAFSRCDKFSQAADIASRGAGVFGGLSGGIMGNLASGVLGRFMGGRGR